MKLVLVHGRSQQGKDPRRLQGEWVPALTEGLAKSALQIPKDAKIVFPFYGDRLDEFARQFELPLGVEVTAKGGAKDREYLEFRAEMFDAFRRRAGISDAEVDSEYGGNPKPKGPLNWEWVQAILRTLDRHVPAMSDRTLELFTRDVFLYTRRPGVRDEIDAIVAETITEDEPCVVVSHSLGTVVAYSVLSRDRRRLHVPLFITLGSPLGVRAIRNQFKPLKFPASASSWYNAFDKRDVVVLNPLDAVNFPVMPRIRNDDKVKNDTKNRHGIVGYLKDPSVAKVIGAALTGP
ncbi:MAG: alpha/beta hydrolase [Chloroflexi bacterium]|nr:alpha/beta hydrolase [Chloroflexota bacterium]